MPDATTVPEFPADIPLLMDQNALLTPERFIVSLDQILSNNHPPGDVTVKSSNTLAAPTLLDSSFTTPPPAVTSPLYHSVMSARAELMNREPKTRRKMRAVVFIPICLGS